MMKKAATISKYGYGYRTLWSIPAVQELARKHGFKPPGGYSKKNPVKGKFYCSAGESDFLTGPVCGDLLFLAYQEGATKSQLEAISKVFSWGWQLKTGKEGNFEEVRDQWKNAFEPDKFAPPKHTHIRAEIALPTKLVGKAMTTEWHPECGMPYPRWCPSHLLATDYFMSGGRRCEDLKRIRDSRDSEFSKTAQYQWTQMVGGRCKQSKNFGEKAWRAWRTCSCPNEQHQGLPHNTYQENVKLFDSEGNPKNLTWCTTCPLTSYEVIQVLLTRSRQEPDRNYPKWLATTHRYGKGDVSEKNLALEAHEWIRIQGANPENLKLHTNSGRKTLGLTCEELNIPEPVSFQNHGNQCKNWHYYQPRCQRVLTHKTRKQSLEPRIATECHRMQYRSWGRGAPQPVKPEPVSREEFEQRAATTHQMIQQEFEDRANTTLTMIEQVKDVTRAEFEARGRNTNALFAEMKAMLRVNMNMLEQMRR